MNSLAVGGRLIVIGAISGYTTSFTGGFKSSSMLPLKVGYFVMEVILQRRYVMSIYSSLSSFLFLAWSSEEDKKKKKITDRLLKDV